MHSIEKVWIKTEPTDIESTTTYFSIKCEDGIHIKSEPSTSSATGYIKSEIGIVETGTSTLPETGYKTETSTSPQSVFIKPEITIIDDYQGVQSDSIAPLPNQDEAQEANVDASNKKYKCDECGAKFARKHSITIHQKIHTGQRPYVCECGKKFARKQILINHQRIHSGERPFACNECEMKFTQKAHLTQHKQTHIDWGNKKPFQCDECGTQFARKSGLNQHKRNFVHVHLHLAGPR